MFTSAPLSYQPSSALEQSSERAYAAESLLAVAAGCGGDVG